jgi:hypothetical protein
MVWLIGRPLETSARAGIAGAAKTPVKTKSPNKNLRKNPSLRY